MFNFKKLKNILKGDNYINIFFSKLDEFYFKFLKNNFEKFKKNFSLKDDKIDEFISNGGYVLLIIFIILLYIVQDFAVAFLLTCICIIFLQLFLLYRISFVLRKHSILLNKYNKIKNINNNNENNIKEDKEDCIACDTCKDENNNNENNIKENNNNNNIIKTEKKRGRPRKNNN